MLGQAFAKFEHKCHFLGGEGGNRRKTQDAANGQRCSGGFTCIVDAQFTSPLYFSRFKEFMLFCRCRCRCKADIIKRPRQSSGWGALPGNVS